MITDRSLNTSWYLAGLARNAARSTSWPAPRYTRTYRHCGGWRVCGQGRDHQQAGASTANRAGGDSPHSRQMTAVIAGKPGG